MITRNRTRRQKRLTTGATQVSISTGGSSGLGDVTGPAASVDGEFALFSGTSGKLLKRATGSGVVRSTSGVMSVGQVALGSEVSGDLPLSNLAQAAAAARVLGRRSGSAGDFEELTPTLGLEIDSTNLRMTAGARTRAITFIIDGGGSALTTGIKGDLSIPFACTITGARALADQSGSVVVDIWKDTYANYPPTDADSITASAPVTISTATKSDDTTLTGWTTSIAAGDTLRFNVDSATTITRVVIILTVTVP